jgi:hypothetical protein
MRVLTVLVSSVLLSVSVTGMTGCAASPAPPPAAAPIAYNAADYNPPSEFDMSFAAQGVAKGPAVGKSEPVEASYRARLVSMEKPSDEVAH